MAGFVSGAQFGRKVGLRVAIFAGLTLGFEQVIPFEIDYAEWLNRGSGGPANAELIDGLLDERPSSAVSFAVSGTGAERRLALRNSVTRWVV